ncbi:MAG: hypothetical protein ABW252_21275 [Polyangiales bacterium]
MQKRKLHRTTACITSVLVMLLSASACAPASSDDEVDVELEAAVLDARESGGEDALVRDDFERGTVAAPLWRKSGDVRVRVDAAHTGAFGVQLGRRAALVTQVDTRGKRDLSLRFDARAVDLERGEVLLVELSVGGRWFVPVARIRDAAWATRTVPLPALADDRDDVRVRFVVLASDDFGRERAFEGVLIDNVTISAGVQPAYDDDADLPVI